VIREKYKSSKAQLEKYRAQNNELKAKVKQRGTSVSRSDRSRSVHKTSAYNDRGEIMRLQSVIERLKKDLMYHQMRSEQIQFSSKNIHQQSDVRTWEKKLEGEKSKNFYLENENMRLQQQIRELNMKYKTCIDEKNRSTVEQYVSQRKISSNRPSPETQQIMFGLKNENKTLKEKLSAMSNEIKMNKNISEAVALKESELQNVKNYNEQLQKEIKLFETKIHNLENEIKMLNDLLEKKESESANSGNDHMIEMYKKLYNDMKNECNIYMNKLDEMRQKIQSGQYNQNTVSFSKKVYQGKSYKIYLIIRWKLN
jgi:chromosome segregation ATPase